MMIGANASKKWCQIQLEFQPNEQNGYNPKKTPNKNPSELMVSSVSTYFPRISTISNSYDHHSKKKEKKEKRKKKAN